MEIWGMTILDRLIRLKKIVVLAAKVVGIREELVEAADPRGWSARPRWRF
jgi:hypothetical protein